MMPLTEDVPKPLLKVRGKTLIQYVYDALPKDIDEIIIVVKYKGQEIEKYCQENFLDRKISFVYQESFSGTGGALELCADVLEDKFLVMLADDIHGAISLGKAIQHPACIVVAESDTPECFGVVEHENGSLVSIVEKPEHPKGNLVSTGAMVLTKDIFKFKAPVLASGEQYLPDMLQQYAKKYPVSVEVQEMWIPLGYPKDIEKAEEILQEDK